MTDKINQYDSEGKQHGIWEYYYSDGKLRLRCNYLHGQLHGKWEDYRADGTRIWKENYIRDKECGLSEYYIWDNILYHKIYYLNIK